MAVVNSNNSSNQNNAKSFTLEVNGIAINGIFVNVLHNSKAGDLSDAQILRMFRKPDLDVKLVPWQKQEGNSYADLVGADDDGAGDAPEINDSLLTDEEGTDETPFVAEA